MQYQIPSPPWELGQVVYHEQQQWYVTGVSLRCGYDTRDWEVHLSRSMYTVGDYPGCPWQGRSDVCAKAVRDDEVQSVEVFNRTLIERSRRDIAEAEARLKAMKESLSRIESTEAVDASDPH